ncbi:MAG: transglutaminase domain-containing protein [Anaerolineae bacterium]|nr:transglutaminase domain-containing protein [Anaerolineae bacterium]
MTQTLPGAPLYYAQPGPVTVLPPSPASEALLAGLPDDVAGIVQAVQGNLIHIFWAERYGVTLSDERKAEVQIRAAAAMLDRIYAVDPAPLTTPRPDAQKLVGNCRDFSVLTCALLQYKGIPARARCGFGVYFINDHYEDHWIVEYWHAGEARWVAVDAQLDDLQRREMNIPFDPLDMPPGQFVSGGRAWQLARDEGEDPDKFGIFEMHGLWFIRGNLVRDIAALNQLPLLPWDSWGAADEPDEALSADDLALLDRAAALSLAGNDSFAEMQALYTGDARLRVPPVINSYAAGPEPIRITLADVLPAPVA